MTSNSAFPFDGILSHRYSCLFVNDIDGSCGTCSEWKAILEKADVRIMVKNGSIHPIVSWWIVGTTNDFDPGAKNSRWTKIGYDLIFGVSTFFWRFVRLNCKHWSRASTIILLWTSVLILQRSGNSLKRCNRIPQSILLFLQRPPNGRWGHNVIFKFVIPPHLQRPQVQCENCSAKGWLLMKA